MVVILVIVMVIEDTSLVSDDFDTRIRSTYWLILLMHHKANFGSIHKDIRFGISVFTRHVRSQFHWLSDIYTCCIICQHCRLVAA